MCKTSNNSVRIPACPLSKSNKFSCFKEYRYLTSAFNRPGFKEMLADIEAGHISTVIVKDMSRFGRNYLEVGMYTEIMFPEKDIHFIAINDGVDSDRDDSDFTPFRNIINEWYAKDTSKKIRAVIRAKGMSSERLGSQVPYGYTKDENGRLLVDAETAPIVRMIYELCAEGNGPGKIARILRERKINTPRTTDFLRTGRSDHYDPDAPCGWTSATVAGILSKKEYLGHTVNFKTTRKSFKCKKVIHNPEEKQMVFEQTHEAIISLELWDVVQKIREQRHRPTRTGEIALFSGIIFCADCGSNLTLHRQRANSKARRAYMCSRYRNSRGQYKCDAHYVREDDLETLVLENLRKVIAFARDYEDEFVQQVTDNTLVEQMKEQSATKRQLEQQTRRIGEIDTIIQRLYEDNLSGKLTDARFVKLSSDYEQEQENLKALAATLHKEIAVREAKEVDAKNFVAITKKYTDLQELDATVLREFIERIYIYERDKQTNTQEVQIVYNFIGAFNFAEVAEQQANSKKTGATSKT